MRFFQQGETADSKFTFLDSETGQPINVINPTYRITHYAGPTETIDVPDTALTLIAGRTGEYISSWLIPGTVPVNETYFVTAQGTHPTEGTTTNLEDFYRVLSANYFGGNSSGLVIKFTKS